MITNTDEKYMRMCFKLALKGKGKTSPNPMVGCVVLDKNGKVVSKGYHKAYGKNHAERDALLKLKNNEAEGGTLYVNLEPCSHWGKTPPCTDIIIERKLRRVVFACRDINKKVNGAEVLKSAGIQVTEGVLEDEAKFLNREFFKNIKTQMPYVVLKTATTFDGKIATRIGDSKWITSPKSRELVYGMRKEFDCILTTSNTVIADNPSMVHKYKCILDKDLRVPKNSQIFSQGEIYLASRENTPIKEGGLDVGFVLKELYKRGVYSVFVESGGTLAGYLLKNGLAEEVWQFIAPKILNDNSGMSCFNGADIEKISGAKSLRVYSLEYVEPDILVKSVVLN